MAVEKAYRIRRYWPLVLIRSTIFSADDVLTEVVVLGRMTVHNNADLLDDNNRHQVDTTPPVPPLLRVF